MKPLRLADIGGSLRVAAVLLHAECLVRASARARLSGFTFPSGVTTGPGPLRSRTAAGLGMESAVVLSRKHRHGSGEGFGDPLEHGPARRFLLGAALLLNAGRYGLLELAQCVDQ